MCEEREQTPPVMPTDRNLPRQGGSCSRRDTGATQAPVCAAVGVRGGETVPSSRRLHPGAGVQASRSCHRRAQASLPESQNPGVGPWERARVAEWSGLRSPQTCLYHRPEHLVT